MTRTKQKPKGTIFKVQSIAIANPLYIDLIHQCVFISQVPLHSLYRSWVLQGIEFFEAVKCEYNYICSTIICIPAELCYFVGWWLWKRWNNEEQCFTGDIRLCLEWPEGLHTTEKSFAQGLEQGLEEGLEQGLEQGLPQSLIPGLAGLAGVAYSSCGRVALYNWKKVWHEVCTRLGTSFGTRFDTRFGWSISL